MRDGIRYWMTLRRGGVAVSGVTTYTKTLNATLKALPGKKVTAGKVTATAQVIIQLQ